MDVLHRPLYETDRVRPLGLRVDTLLCHNSRNISEHGLQLSVPFLVWHLELSFGQDLSRRNGWRMTAQWKVHLLKYNFELLVLHLSIFSSCHFLLHYISEGNIALFTPLHLSECFNSSDFPQKFICNYFDKQCLNILRFQILKCEDSLLLLLIIWIYVQYFWGFHCLMDTRKRCEGVTLGSG